MSDQIITRIDEMGTRIDDLERNIADLMTQAGPEEVDKWNYVYISTMYVVLRRVMSMWNRLYEEQSFYQIACILKDPLLFFL